MSVNNMAVKKKKQESSFMFPWSKPTARQEAVFNLEKNTGVVRRAGESEDVYIKRIGQETGFGSGVVKDALNMIETHELEKEKAIEFKKKQEGINRVIAEQKAIYGSGNEDSIGPIPISQVLRDFAKETAPTYHVTEELLADFYATMKAKPYLGMKDILKKFPEFGNDETFAGLVGDLYQTIVDNEGVPLSDIKRTFPELTFWDDKPKKKQESWAERKLNEVKMETKKKK